MITVVGPEVPVERIWPAGSAEAEVQKTVRVSQGAVAEAVGVEVAEVAEAEAVRFPAQVAAEVLLIARTVPTRPS